jgi:hypothetical protein
MEQQETIQVGDLCQRLHVHERQLRYLLEQSHLPLGVEPAPQRGHHRQITAAQAFWLAIVLKLKAAGVSAPRAAAIATRTQELFAKTTATQKWDPTFAPFAGRLVATHTWIVEIGDERFMRIRAEGPGSVYLGPWQPWGPGTPERDSPGSLAPLVSLRLDLTGLARLLRRDVSNH